MNMLPHCFYSIAPAVRRGGGSPMIGKTLGHYQIISELGKGGMGEVYQAKDQKLGRDVAIKVLPDEFARDADRVVRFQREAKVLASLNHPNIAAIYGLEESGGTNFLVLELVEGETLAEQLKRGPIPVEQSLKLALQIAEALEAAHEKGIIHRDLKPANIKVTPDGKVKVLDFGLAKAFGGDGEKVNLSNSPTLSDAATRQGVILGTAAYMSPEQARGESVDKRADVWAFGCVLFEMLTGRTTFEGRTVTDVLASVIKIEPAWNQLPSNLHPRIRLLLERCLEKESKNRYHDIADVRVDIQEALTDPSGVLVLPAAAAESQSKSRMLLPWIAVAMVLTAIVAGAAVWKLKPPEPRRVMRFTHELPEGQQFIPGLGLRLCVSRDGGQFVYVTTNGLYLRSLEALDARLIAGTDKDSTQPFFSPDGQWIGYWCASDRKLKKIAVSGGAPAVLCETGPLFYGASWYSDDMILYGDALTGIMRISASGGTPEILIKTNPADKEVGSPILPQMLPDGKTLLYTGALDTNLANMKIVMQSLESGKRKVLLRSGLAPWYLPTGHIIFIQANNNTGSLFAIPFNLDRLETTGGAVPIIEGIADAAVSRSGTLIYVPLPKAAAESKDATSSRCTLVWVNRQGKEELLAAAPNEYGPFKISPDGTRVALTIGNDNSQDIWIWELTRGTKTRLTFREGEDIWPLWTPDGQRIVYQSGADINWKAADGSGEVEKLASWPNAPGPFTWSKDGKILLTWELNLSGLQSDIGMMSMEGDHARKPLLQEKYCEDHPQISPDGRWLAYASNESGQSEVYVRPFPEINKGRWPISTSGGSGPLWSPDGKELFYRNGESVMAVPVETGPLFKAGKVKELFRGNYVSTNVGSIILPMWDISPDGKRFLMMKQPGSTGAAPTTAVLRKINIILNWSEELKQRVPSK
jgi:Tol biopolymer transport system component